MSTVPVPDQVLKYLQAAAAELRRLAALPSADPAHARAASQLEAVIAELEGRPASGLDPVPPNPE